MGCLAPLGESDDLSVCVKGLSVMLGKMYSLDPLDQNAWMLDLACLLGHGHAGGGMLEGPL